MKNAIDFSHVSKYYRQARGEPMIRDGIVAAVKLATGRRATTINRLAIDDVSFSVPVGQACGIIGPNGAGKTTVLRLASRVTRPTSGSVFVEGRLGSIIDFGTGLHPELSGRENIYICGRIMGHSRRSISRVSRAVIEFARLERAADMPIKHYSSGMKVRLAFSLSVFVESDIIFVDEALALADAEFQYQSVKKLRELVRGGRTLVFVSHDVALVEQLCERAILLVDGRVAYDGGVREAARRIGLGS